MLTTPIQPRGRGYCLGSGVISRRHPTMIAGLHLVGIGCCPISPSHVIQGEIRGVPGSAAPTTPSTASWDA